jgi:hypothetical protein
MTRGYVELHHLRQLIHVALTPLEELEDRLAT